MRAKRMRSQQVAASLRALYSCYDCLLLFTNLFLYIIFFFFLIFHLYFNHIPYIGLILLYFTYFLFNFITGPCFLELRTKKLRRLPSNAKQLSSQAAR